MTIRHHEARKLPSLGLDKSIRDALASYVRLRWPTGTAKHAAKEFGLSIDAAKSVVAGKPSLVTVETIWKSPNGGWPVILPVLGAVIGTTLDQHLETERNAHAARAEKLGEVVRSLRFGRPAGDLRPDQFGSEPGERRQPQDRRVGR